MSEQLHVSEGQKIPRRAVVISGEATVELSERQTTVQGYNEVFHCPNLCPVPGADSLPKRRGRKVPTALLRVTSPESASAVVLMPCYNCGTSMVKREKKDSALSTDSSDSL